MEGKPLTAKAAQFTAHFMDRLLEACRQKNSRLVVGLDPHIALLPQELLPGEGRTGEDRTGEDRTGEGRPGEGRTGAEPNLSAEAASRAILEFNRRIIPAVADHAAAVKPQLAFYERWGWHGMQAYGETVKIAHQHGLLVIADAKRCDIGSTAEAYAAAYLGPAGGEKAADGGVAEDGAAAMDSAAAADDVDMEADAITLQPYMGKDGIEPFLRRWTRGKGFFVLVRTSNPGAGDVQDLTVGEEKLYERVAALVEEWGSSSVSHASGFSALGAVAGATYPRELARLRRLMPHTFFLVPGYGAQGGDAASVRHAFLPDGSGAVVNSSRQVIFAYREQKCGGERWRKGEGWWADCARQAAERARLDINAVLAL
ncbi:MAG TPA: orotidine-5'-phosphate decarboxylase [Firmicutes bacterium]|nr:orotidine-5'-phosphate decarboxylase [Bacillota bacterium]